MSDQRSLEKTQEEKFLADLVKFNSDHGIMCIPSESSTELNEGGQR